MIIMEINKVDICCGLCWGDEAKGKIVSSLINSLNYDFVCRWGGGSNAGHTIYVNEKKYHTHIIPSGVFHNVISFIGPDCYINIDDFKTELKYLLDNGFDINLVKKRFYIPEEDKWIILKVKASVLKTINKKGIYAVLKEARENGQLK